MASFLVANFLATLYFVFFLWAVLRPPSRYGTKYHVARKVAKRNGAITYAKAGRIYPILYLALLFLIVNHGCVDVRYYTPGQNQL